MNNTVKLKNRIKEFRQAKGISQTRLAEMVGTTQNTISSLETGQYMPSAFLAGLITIALDCKFEDCFYYVKVEDEK